MRLLITLCLLCAAGCGSGSSYYFPPNPDGSPPVDGSATPRDLTASLDFTVPVDLTTPSPDFAGPACLSGHYAGPATASVANLFMLSGTIDLQLGAAQNGVLPITQGSATATGNFMGQNVSLAAGLQGGLDCNATKVSWVFVNGMFNLGLQAVPVTGNGSATYDSQSSAMTNGTLTATAMGLTGNGTWSATHQ